jgi:hypothetical protein
MAVCLTCEPIRIQATDLGVTDFLLASFAVVLLLRDRCWKDVRKPLLLSGRLLTYQGACFAG